MSSLFVPTLKENPQEAEIASHSLMLRAGMIRQLSSGVYIFLPLGLRTLNKITKIVKEEMDRAGGRNYFYPLYTLENCGKRQEDGRFMDQN